MLILKNETTGVGDLYIEGTVKQLKAMLKNNLIVKPACMFDQSIKIDIHVSFAANGKYSDQHSRQVSFELAQVQKAVIRSELDHEYKYRFLTMDEAGNITPLYSKDQTINGGAGDLMLTFTGFAGSGTEYCDITTQTLTRGSQY